MTYAQFDRIVSSATVFANGALVLGNAMCTMADAEVLGPPAVARFKARAREALGFAPPATSSRSGGRPGRTAPTPTCIVCGKPFAGLIQVPAPDGRVHNFCSSCRPTL